MCGEVVLPLPVDALHFVNGPDGVGSPARRFPGPISGLDPDDLRWRPRSVTTMPTAGPVRSSSHPPDAAPDGAGPATMSYHTFEPEPLWYIALYMLGSAAYWREVADANRNALADLEPLTRETVVPSGRTLELPEPGPVRPLR